MNAQINTLPATHEPVWDPTPFPAPGIFRLKSSQSDECVIIYCCTWYRFFPSANQHLSMCLLGMVLFSSEIVSGSLQPRGRQPARLLCPWDFPAKNTGVGCHFLFQGIFLTQGLNLWLLDWQADSLPPSHQGSPCYLTNIQENHLPLPRRFPAELYSVCVWSSIFSSAIVSSQCLWEIIASTLSG